MTKSEFVGPCWIGRAQPCHPIFQFKTPQGGSGRFIKKSEMPRSAGTIDAWRKHREQEDRPRKFPHWRIEIEESRLRNSLEFSNDCRIRCRFFRRYAAAEMSRRIVRP